MLWVGFVYGMRQSVSIVVHMQRYILINWSEIKLSCMIHARPHSMFCMDYHVFLFLSLVLVSTRTFSIITSSSFNPIFFLIYRLACSCNFHTIAFVKILTYSTHSPSSATMHCVCVCGKCPWRNAVIPTPLYGQRFGDGTTSR